MNIEIISSHSYKKGGVVDESHNHAFADTVSGLTISSECDCACSDNSFSLHADSDWDCDCACPDYGFSVDIMPTTANNILQQPRLHKQTL